MLAHHRGEAALELAEEVAEARVAVAIWMRVPVLFPEHHEVDARPPHLAGQRWPVRLDPSAGTLLHAGAGEEALLENGVGDLGLEWPHDARRGSASEVVLHRRSRDPERPPDLARTHPIAGKPQHLSGLSHGQLSPGRHPVLLVPEEGCRGADPRGTPPPISATRWPASSRNGGRLQIGTTADIISE